MILYLLLYFFASKNEKKSDEESEKKSKNLYARLYFDALNNENFKKLSPMAFKVYGSMLEYADWKTGLCYPSQKKLAENCGCSRKTVNQKIEELRKFGYIRKISEAKTKPIYYITAYEKRFKESESELVTPVSQVVTSASQGCNSEVTRDVTPSSHKQYTVTKTNNDNQQQIHNQLELSDLIHTTRSGDEPVSVEAVCCNISNIFSKKFGTELPNRFVKEKIKSGEIFDDQFYIQIITTQQRMPDNPIGWWRSIDETWVADDNVRPVDRVGTGWRIYRSTVEIEKQNEDDEKALRTEAEQIREERLKQAVEDFPPLDEYTEKRVQEIIDARNLLVEDKISNLEPYTNKEIAEIREKVMENYPKTDEDKRQIIFRNSHGEYDVSEIMEELREEMNN